MITWLKTNKVSITLATLVVVNKAAVTKPRKLNQALIMPYWYVFMIEEVNAQNKN